MAACVVVLLAVASRPVGASVAAWHSATDAHAHPASASVAIPGAGLEIGVHRHPDPDCAPQLIVLPVTRRAPGRAASARLSRVFSPAMRENLLTFDPPPRRSQV